MSFRRLIYLSCIVGGWSGFIGWLFLEIAIGRWVDQYTILAILMATLVAVPIGGGISLASGLTNPQLVNLLKRLLLGFAGGLIGGLVGSLIGGCIFAVFQSIPVLGFLSRVFGWTMIGMGIGVTEGILDRSLKKTRNGFIGGAVGGFLAGFFFIPVSFVIGSPTSSRMVSFVLLGLFIGLSIGLAQVLLKEAWLVVEDGFRPGRQVILGQDQITMGTSEKASLIFIAFGAKGVEPVHLKITKQKAGGYLLEDNQSRSGTLLNGQPVNEPTLLRDDDTIQFGVNVVRFKERIKHGDSALPTPVIAAKDRPTPVLPPPVKPAPTAPPAKTAPQPAPAVVVVKVASAPATPNAVAPTPAPPKAAVPAQPQEGRCPICDKKILGVPGQRRCGKCFTTF
jgi:hypothetical protein